MKNSFTAIANNKFSRHFGGTQIGVADPYVTGYHFIYFAALPAALNSYLGQLYPGKYGSVKVENMLSALCMSVTPPGGTLNKVEFTGLGGIKWAVPGNIDYGNEVSIKFLEMKDTPILDIMHAWIKIIRDYRVGSASDLISDTTGAGYSNKTYAAELYYWTTSPDGENVQYYAGYDGVFPNKDPQDLFTSDVESIGRLDVEIGFNVDHVWHEKWVYDKCMQLASTFAADKTQFTKSPYLPTGS